MDTPPVPCVKTHWPAFRALPSSPYSPFHAVRPAHVNVAASSKLNPSGIFTKPFSSNAPYCLSVPCTTPPRPVWIVCELREPPRCPWLKSVTTLSPFLKRVVFSPTATTVPAPSEQGMMEGATPKGYLPLVLLILLVLNMYLEIAFW